MLFTGTASPARLYNPRVATRITPPVLSVEPAISLPPPQSPNPARGYQPLPALVTSLPTPDLLAALDAAARRGKLGGFSPASRPPALFTVRDFGGPFESVLTASRPAAQPTGPLTFDLRLLPRLAWVYLVVLIATVWPGVWLTDSMLRTYFPGYDYQTWMWYIPLTAPFVPWAMLTAIRRSRLRGRADAAEILDSLARITGGRLEPASGAEPASAAAAPEPT